MSARRSRAHPTARRRRADAPFDASDGQLRVGEVLARLLPRGSLGTRPAGQRAWHDDLTPWQVCPPWPPDLFAVAATLVQKSGAYAYRVHDVGRGGAFDADYVEFVTGLGQAWRESLTVPSAVQELWSTVCAQMRVPLDRATPEWRFACLKLLASADEASVGIGYVDGATQFAALVASAYAVWANRRRLQEPLMHLPHSLAWRVPPSECCVLPKARTPQVGITLAALSHHLTLLPSATEVHPRWLPNPVKRPSPRGGHRPFNLLLVPYPYRIHGSAFVAGPAGPGGRERAFGVRQEWLERCRPGQFARFVCRLVQAAREEVGGVHGVALPELALDETFFGVLRKALGREGVQLLVSGVHARRRGAAVNQVRTAVYDEGRLLNEEAQDKHHRWKLDAGQIRRYHLGHALDPSLVWTEQTDIARRECMFLQISAGAVLATLVCEDLVRIEPVQTVLRSVGPNLLIAVLMDGPQYAWRWPGRSATVLADDPGSAVLTLTSLGMVRRSVMPGEAEPREIALWKEPAGDARELKLARDDHGLLLSLALSQDHGYSLDERSDRGTSLRVALSGVHGVKDPRAEAWLDA